MNQKQATPVNVNLTLQTTGTDPGWHMEIVGAGKGGPNNYPKIDVPKGPSDVPFKFQITGPGTQGITFGSDPIWVAADDGSGASPKEAGVHSQITSVSGGGTKSLTFTDLNSEKVTLTYQLNFSDGSTLDPIINNGGGEDGLAAYALLIGLAVFAVIAFLAFRSRARARAQTPADQ